MILENLELENREAAQVELEQLAEVIRQEGLPVKVAPLDGSFHSILEESADHIALDVLNIVLAATETAMIETTLGALFRWAKRRKHFRDPEDGKATAVIWGPDGRVLREVRLPEPEDEPLNGLGDDD
jgi:hypothetical protein